MGLVLWGNGASRARNVHWMLHELGIDYEKKLIGSRTGETQTEEFLRLNPQGKIPVLEDGDFVLTENAAIITYLAEKYGNGTHLIPPADSQQRARYNQWCFFAMMELDAQSLYIVRKHTELSHIYREAPAAVEVGTQTFLKQVKVVDRALRDGRDWLMGENFPGADILITGCLESGIHYDLPVSKPTAAYVARATARKAYVAAALASNP